MVLVQRRRHLLGQDAGGIVLGARAALLDDHLALGLHLFRVELEVDHAVGLHLHHRLQAILGDALEVARVVVRGEGVVLAAHARDAFGELARRDLVGRLEHQVLEEVRDARHAGRLIGGAHPIPHVVRHHRRAIVGDDDQLQAVGELVLADAGGDRAGFEAFEGLREHHYSECKEEKRKLSSMDMHDRSCARAT